MRLRAYLLGEFRLIVEGRLIDTSSRRSRNLLAYLLVRRDAPVPRDVLMETFWPRVRPAAARNSLHVALSGARRMLREASAEEVIERRLDAYRISRSAEVWTDADEFERCCRAGRRAVGAVEQADHYEAAALLYRGVLLAEEPYADWVVPRRETLRTLALEAESRLVALYAERGDHGPAATLARRILADDPCNEDVHRGLMLCYAENGLRHLALLQYRQLATTLWDDLRVRPAPETTALFERLRRPESLPRPV
jgi:DNA-binding SARP family transcriptional activator